MAASGPSRLMRTGGNVLEWFLCVHLQETVWTSTSGPRLLNISKRSVRSVLHSVYFPPQSDVSTHFITTVRETVPCSTCSASALASISGALHGWITPVTFPDDLCRFCSPAGPWEWALPRTPPPGCTGNVPHQPPSTRDGLFRGAESVRSGNPWPQARLITF